MINSLSVLSTAAMKKREAYRLYTTYVVLFVEERFGWVGGGGWVGVSFVLAPSYHPTATHPPHPTPSKRIPSCPATR